jgi:hypothetical protein
VALDLDRISRKAFDRCPPTLDIGELGGDRRLGNIDDG